MSPKSIATWSLSLFVAMSVGVLIGKEMAARSRPPAEAPNPPAAALGGPRVIVYDFHGEARCATCKAIEAAAREVLAAFFAEELSSGRIEFRSVNFEEPANQHFLDDYQLVSSSLVLVAPGSSAANSWKVLPEIWTVAHNRRAAVEYLKQELNQFLAQHGG